MLKDHKFDFPGFYVHFLKSYMLADVEFKEVYLYVILMGFKDYFGPVDCRPSTFAQAAKLKRLATAKEKELANCEANCSLSRLLFVSFDLYCKFT